MGRPLAKFEGGSLWLDMGGVYSKASRIAVLAMLAQMEARPGNERHALECREALRADAE